MQATDTAGNTDPTPATWSWTVDTTAPVVTITGGPTGVTSTRSGTVTFTVSESATTMCSLDGGLASTCLSSYAVSALADGSHTVTVLGTDAAGNLSAAATRTWTVDGTAPVVTITGGPTGVTSSSSGTVTFTVSESATAACSLDGGTATVCTGSYLVSALVDGSHTVSVVATDAAGNVSAAATRTWTVDSAVPDTTITAKPAALTNASTASFSFTSTKAGSTFQCSRDGGTFAACTSGASFAVVAGAHTFAVRATDPSGNTDPSPATWSWTVDTTAPVVTITGGPERGHLEPLRDGDVHRERVRYDDVLP